MASKEKRFAIIDVETTGGRPARDKITEIGIVMHDGRQILDTFESLVNPDCYIPAGITQLTGITQEMVDGAPRFYEIAREIVKLTEGAVFVAHNARFDYNFIREEFSRLGYTFSRRQLCTVRLCRKVFPGLHSYSLENLIHHFGISTNQRHRALADALATTELLQRVLAAEENQEDLKLLVDMGIKESRLPHGITLDQLHNLPESCGIYYLHDARGDVIYVGKSINIRKRIAEHFGDQTSKGRILQEKVADISFELTGSELVALLLESQEIKRLSPPVNRAQRRQRFPYAVHAYYNKEGYLCFDVIQNSAQARKQYDIISEYPTLTRAKGRLNHLVKDLELCSRFCHLFPGKGACFHYHLRQCRGGCAGKESVEDYNERAEQARERLRTIFDQDFLLFDQGRTADEQAVILVERGHYRGFGFIDATAEHDLSSLQEAIRPTQGYPDTARIIQRFLSDNPKARVIPLDGSKRLKY